MILNEMVDTERLATGICVQAASDYIDGLSELIKKYGEKVCDIDNTDYKKCKRTYNHNSYVIDSKKESLKELNGKVFKLIDDKVYNMFDALEFFGSTWQMSLCPVDMNDIVDKLKEQAKTNVREGINGPCGVTIYNLI